MDEKIDPDFKESIRIIRNKVERSAKEHGLKTLVHYGEDFACSGHLYLIRVPGITIEQRNDIIVKMVERGIACNVHYKPLPMMTAYKELGWDMKDFPNAYTYYSNEITLLLHTKLTEEDIAYAIQNFTEIVKEYI